MTADSTTPTRTRPRRSRLRVMFVAVMLLTLSSVVAWWLWPQPGAEPVAVKAIARVNRLAFSPDKEAAYLAAIQSDGRVRLWATATRRELPVKFPSQWPLNDLTWGAGGSVLYVGGFEEHVLGWNLQASRPIKLPKFATPVVSIAAHPKRAELLVSLSNGELWRVDLQSESRETIASGHQGIVKVVRFHPDGKSFVTGGADRQLVWHDAETGSVSRSLAAHDHEISSIAFNRDGTQLVSGSWDNTAKVWRRDAAKPETILTHPEGISTVDWQGVNVVTACWDGLLRVWDAGESDVIHERPCRGDALAFAVWPGHDQIAEVDAAGTLQLSTP